MLYKNYLILRLNNSLLKYTAKSGLKVVYISVTTANYTGSEQQGVDCSIRTAQEGACRCLECCIYCLKIDAKMQLYRGVSADDNINALPILLDRNA